MLKRNNAYKRNDKMLRRCFIFTLALIIAFGGVQIEAAGLITDTMTDLSREAQHYYNTCLAFANMTISRPDEATYLISHMTQSGRSVNIHLYLTEWGTWNLGDMRLSDGISEKVVIGGGTDWEYVFRVYNPITDTLDFVGGNHGSEALNSIEFREGVTGEAFTLNVGESRYVARLVIEENTTIKITNTDYLDFANVTRLYTIVGDTVNLDCRVAFTRDVKLAQSFSAMACINKDFSRYCNFEGIAFSKCEPYGSFSNKKYGNVAASVCTLNGDDPSATVTVGIYNEKDMTDNFSNKDKTFIWDMSAEFNKLYFSKYDMTVLNTVRTGTEWNFAAYWKVNVL
ncbi:MAG: hypothetical protein IKU60_02615 [Clostridia bacterium]|nr:hypothetical protein [Clostridia bacterium]